ncbi:hypothetical protein FOZ63_019210, partial [Perkinsus olseni]
DALKMLRRGYVPPAEGEFAVLIEVVYHECLETHVTELVSAAKRTGQLTLVLDSSTVTVRETLYSAYGSFREEGHSKVVPFGSCVVADCSEDAAERKISAWIEKELWPKL